MFSRITEPFLTVPVKKDTVPTQDPAAVRETEREKQRQKRGEGQTPEEERATLAEEDITAFSLSAIRILLQQEKVPPMNSVFAHLDLLEKAGLREIPIRLGQEVPAAVREAAVMLGLLPR